MTRTCYRFLGNDAPYFVSAMNETSCPVCGGPAQIKPVAKAFGRGDNLLVIEDIPLVVCKSCHEQYIAAETLHEIEQLRERRQHQARMIHVERFAA